MQLQKKYVKDEYKGQLPLREQAFFNCLAANALKDLKRYNEALPHFLEAVEIMETLAKKYPSYGNHWYFLNEVKIQLSDLYVKLGNDEKAHALLVEVIEPLKNGYSNIIASIFYDLGYYEKALTFYEASIEYYGSSGTGENNLYLGVIFNRLGGLYEWKDSLDRAEEYYTRSLGNATHRVSHVFDHFSEEEQTGLWAQIQTQYGDQQSFALRHPDNGEMLNLCYNGQLLTKGLLLGNRKKLLGSLRHAVDPLLREKYADWENIRGLLARQYGLPKDQRHSAFDSLENRANQLESELAARSAAFREAQQVPGWQEVRERLETV